MNLNYEQEAFTLHFKGITTNMVKKELDFRKIPPIELRENRVVPNDKYIDNELSGYSDTQLQKIYKELDSIESDIQYNNLLKQEEQDMDQER